MDSQVLFAGAAVADITVAAEWWRRLFDRPPDVTAHAEELMWRVADGGWLYLVVDRARAGRSLVSISVGELDGALGALERRRITPSSVEEVPGAGRKATFCDPDQNSVTLVEVRSDR